MVELGVAVAAAWAPDEDAGRDLLAPADGVAPVPGWRWYGWAWSDRVADGDG
jgi:hypothetical protein